MTHWHAEWSAEALGADRRTRLRFFPTELMLHVVLTDRYTGWAPRIEPGECVLDVGTLNGSNLIPFSDRGMACHGVEVNADMVALARSTFVEQGLDAEIREGTNTALPYADGAFALLLSVNVIHYEAGGDGLDTALREYARVLKPRGRAFIVTAGPQHFIRTGADRLGPNRYRLNHDDFRKGAVMAYVEDEAELAARCEAVFSRVVTGRNTEKHPAACLDYVYALVER
ncbi:MAG: class I SAM-dependent methyltransferase [Alphaproteobacteria bacterium]|nr:class I SAM-dependent methyltransferase [Alphaproteobacteria bacterium]